MENKKAKFEFIKEVKSDVTGEETFYYTEKNGRFVTGSLSYNKQEAWSFYVKLSNGEVVEAITKTVIHSSDKFDFENQ